VLAEKAGCVVVSLAYRLAPEHPFPAAVDDAVAGFRAVAAQASLLGLDPARLGVGGDSAGGNLAAVVSQATRDDAIRPAVQLLIYPAVDATMASASMRTLGEGFLLETASMKWFYDHYAPAGVDRRDARISPLLAQDLARLPPALVVTAGFDPLRDEGEAYASALRAAGVAVEYRCYDAMVHGFLNVAGFIDGARESLADAASMLRRAFAR
jgi:acetyl esterase